MAIGYEQIYGHKKGEDQNGSRLFNNDDGPEKMPGIPEGKMAKYKVVADVLVEKGIRFIKGQDLTVDVDADRAEILITHGYIEENKPAEKAIEAAPLNKAIQAEEKKAEPKGATGKGSSLLNKSKGKK